MDLSSNDIKDLRGQPSIRSLPLKELNLSYNEIQKVDSLVNYTKLEHLILTGNKISDTSCLQDLKHLKELHLGNNPFPPSQIRVLKDSLPRDCTIYYYY